MATMVGILSGAVTNTPGLGAAQQTFTDITGTTDPTIATAYAIAYPLECCWIIITLLLLKRIFRIDQTKEIETLEDSDERQEAEAQMFLSN